MATLADSNYTLNGVVVGDTVTVSNTVGAYDTKAAGTGKTVTVTNLALSGADAGNYTVTNTVSGAVGTIIAKTLVATLTGPVSKVYDGTASASLSSANFMLSGVVSGDSVDVAPATGIYAEANVGSGIDVTALGLSLTGTAAESYVLVANHVSGATGTINPRMITVAANDAKMTAGSAVPTLGWSVTAGSLVNGETLSGALATAATSGSPAVSTPSRRVH